MLMVLKITVVLAVIVYLLHRRCSIGTAMFAGAAVVFALTSPTVGTAWVAVRDTIQKASTWEIMLAMYFVMCLEFQLRTCGVLDGFMTSMRRLVSDRFLLAFMPAFLGFLPSLGGALFSAPLVENAARRYALTPEHKTAINYWFRHVWEFTNPIIPSMLLASEITAISLSVLVKSMIWLTILAIAVGWLLCLGRGFTQRGEDNSAVERAKGRCAYRYVLLAGGPVAVNMGLVLFLHLSAAVSMGLVVLAMALILRQNRAAVRAMLIHALDGKVLWGLFFILFFQHMLAATGFIIEFIALLKASGISLPLLVAVTSLIVGLLTGASQALVAIAFPVIAAAAPGDVAMAVTGFVFGTAGQMLSPAHMCLLVTLEYFKTDFVRLLRPIMAMEVLLVGIYVLARYLGWSA